MDKKILYPQLRTGVLEDNQTHELNNILTQLQAYIDHKIANAPLSQVAEQQAGNLFQGLAAPLLKTGETGNILTTVDTGDSDIPLSRIPDIPVTKVIGPGVLDDNLNSLTVLRSVITIVDPPAANIGTIKVEDHNGNAVNVMIA